jgi:hypothetical protein
MINDGFWAPLHPPPPPVVGIGDAMVTEGSMGTRAATFTATLSAASSQPVTVNYSTANSTTTAGSDYQATSGTLIFAPGETTKAITIVVNGDSKKEADETFYQDLSANSSKSLFTKQRGIGTILNDD